MCTIVDRNIVECPGVSYRDPTNQKYVQISGTALAVYDYFLMFDDEIRYVWKGRKSWLFCLYVLYRTVLIGYQFWRVFVVLTVPPPWYYYDHVEHISYADTDFVQPIIFAAFLFLSDIFVMLRVYAISSKNKILTAYIATLALARLVTSLTWANLSITEAYPQPKIASVSVGTALEVSAFTIIIWYTYRGSNMLGFTALVRTVVVQASVWFTAIVIAQIYVQANFFYLVNSLEPSSFAIYGLFIPVLTLRFAVSLRKSANPEGSQKWTLEHFSSIKFASGPPAGSRGSVVHEDIEMEPVDIPRGRVQMDEPRGSAEEITLGDV